MSDKYWTVVIYEHTTAGVKEKAKTEYLKAESVTVTAESGAAHWLVVQAK